jgi:hypothetical protein
VKLRTAHIVVMSSAAALGVLMSLFGVRQLISEEDPASLGLAGAGVALAVGVGFYLRRFIGKPPR